MHFEQKEDNAIDICNFPHDSSPLKQICVTRKNIDTKLQFIFEILTRIYRLRGGFWVS